MKIPNKLSTLLLLLSPLYCILRIPSNVVAQQPGPLLYRTGYFTAKLDNFQRAKGKSHIKIFKLKYLYNYDYHRSGGPVFFHCGGQVAAERIVGVSPDVFRVNAKVSENPSRPGRGVQCSTRIR